jgi:uncharacterized protein YlxP (DUF503 family)
MLHLIHFLTERKGQKKEKEMVIGVCQLDFRIPENHSLKGKRHVIRKLIDRVRHRFNVAISEVGDNDLWQRAQIGICTVGNDRRHINSSLDKVIDFIEKMNLVDMVRTDMEIITI